MASILEGQVASILEGQVARILEGQVARILEGQVASILEGGGGGQVARILEGSRDRLNEVHYNFPKSRGLVYLKTREHFYLIPSLATGTRFSQCIPGEKPGNKARNTWPLIFISDFLWDRWLVF